MILISLIVKSLRVDLVAADFLVLVCAAILILSPAVRRVPVLEGWLPLSVTWWSSTNFWICERDTFNFSVTKTSRRVPVSLLVTVKVLMGDIV